MRIILTLVVFLCSSMLSFAAEPQKLQVYILAGQSNMEGKAKVSLMDYQVAQPNTKDLYQGWHNGQTWVERDDVWVKFLERKGKLTVGFGSPKCIGPELGFGQVIGDRTAAPVLLIKTAWGGRSLYRDFRPPSAGLPEDKVLAEMLSNVQKKKPAATLDEIKQSFGSSYREMLSEVNSTLRDLKTHFPSYENQGYELAGFIWFQGWNDMISAEYTAEYTSNLKHFIYDVRKDLQAKELPFVIAQMGVDGEAAGASVVRFKESQAAVLEEPAFQGNVALVKTDLYWDQAAAAVFKKGWRENIAEWNTVGSDFPFHYLGSPKTLLGVGKACGEAVLKLREKK